MSGKPDEIREKLERLLHNQETDVDVEMLRAARSEIRARSKDEAASIRFDYDKDENRFYVTDFQKIIVPEGSGSTTRPRFRELVSSVFRRVRQVRGNPRANPQPGRPGYGGLGHGNPGGGKTPPPTPPSGNPPPPGDGEMKLEERIQKLEVGVAKVETGVDLGWRVLLAVFAAILASVGITIQQNSATRTELSSRIEKLDTNLDTLQAGVSGVKVQVGEVNLDLMKAQHDSENRILAEIRALEKKIK